MTVKRVIVMAICLIVYIILLTKVIVPSIRVVLDNPTISVFTGLRGFLLFLPFGLCLAAVAIWIFGLRQKDDDE